MKSAKKAVKKAAVARKKAAAKKAGRIARKPVARPKVAAVAAANGDAKVDARSALREEYTIEAKNFGPIAEAKLTLKPLTVLIGPSNMGKTWMATLACMMVKKHVEFVNAARFRMFRRTNYETMLWNAKIGELRNLSEELSDATKGDSVFLSDLPRQLQKLWHPVTEKALKDAWDSVDADLKNFYGVDKLSDLSTGRTGSTFQCGCGVNVNGGTISEVRIKASGNRSAAQSDLQGFRFPIIPQQMSDLISDMRKTIGTSSGAHRKSAVAIEAAIDGILRFAVAHPSAHFLPASRGGLIQAQRVMSIAMMRIAGRAGLSEIRIPTLSRLSVDFLEEIEILLGRISSPRPPVDKPLGIPRLVRLRQPANSKAAKVANKVERFLGGQVVVKKSGGNGGKSTPPILTMGYRPAEFADLGADGILDMAHSSSMVGEIAPLVLYLKGGIEPGDTLFIEEPEAHLHPAAQTQMAEILAAMVRAGIRVVITTHSDWLLDAIANLVRHGETNSGNELSLKEDSVSVYWFQSGKSGKGSEANILPFDNDNGYLPKDVRTESTALYNKAIPLQIQLDKMRSE